MLLREVWRINPINYEMLVDWSFGLEPTQEYDTQRLRINAFA